MNSKRTKKSEGNGQFTRSRVFEVAAEVFHRKGYDNTSMSDVATAAGLTKAGLYHHVSSKESLLFTVLDSGLDLTESYVVKPLETISDPLERLKTMSSIRRFGTRAPGVWITRSRPRWRSAVRVTRTVLVS